ncbi:MAG TPA: shikimate kinase [Terriglobales bacterium]|jgi:shikimate kinase
MHDSEPGLQNPASSRDGVKTIRAAVLVGFMGAGKSTVGRELGRQLSWPFEDLDDRIEAQEGRSVERIFRESGEVAFRVAEHRALQQLISELKSEPRIVALGGGAFVQADNAALLQSSGIPIVFLNASPEELFRRCEEQGTNRPLQRDRAEFLKLYEARYPHYRKAQFQVDTTKKNVPAVAAEIGRLLGLTA